MAVAVWVTLVMLTRLLLFQGQKKPLHYINIEEKEKLDCVMDQAG